MPMLALVRSPVLPRWQCRFSCSFGFVLDFPFPVKNLTWIYVSWEVAGFGDIALVVDDHMDG